MSTNTTPDYGLDSPLGFHAKNIQQYLRLHPTPLSSDPERQEWATPESWDRLSAMFTSTAPHGSTNVMSNLFVYNKTRDFDRICPSCHRIYCVGEGPRAYQSVDEFINRPRSSSEVEPKVQAEQDQSGACCRPCFNALVDDWQDGESRDVLIELRELAGNDGFAVRRSTLGEESETGMKIVWEKNESGAGKQA
ncbi:MAG: hypothetical protein Q9226_008981 [Calogaya cf. arnoldii]